MTDLLAELQTLSEKWRKLAVNASFQGSNALNCCAEELEFALSRQPAQPSGESQPPALEVRMLQKLVTAEMLFKAYAKAFGAHPTHFNLPGVQQQWGRVAAIVSDQLESWLVSWIASRQPSATPPPPEAVAQAMERIRTAARERHDENFLNDEAACFGQPFSECPSQDCADIETLRTFVREGQLRADGIVEKCAEHFPLSFAPTRCVCGWVGNQSQGPVTQWKEHIRRALKGTALLAAPAEVKNERD